MPDQEPRCEAPSRSTLVYERRNGLFTLQITGHPDFGLPFGQDRLVPIFLATPAVRQQSQTIRFRSAALMLEIFGMAKGGKEYRRLVAAFERIFGATIFFDTESSRKQAQAVAVPKYVVSIKAAYAEFPGYPYVWPLWRRNLTDFTPLLFRK
jgi:hypothetical protein